MGKYWSVPHFVKLYYRPKRGKQKNRFLFSQKQSVFAVRNKTKSGPIKKPIGKKKQTDNSDSTADKDY